MKVIWESNDVLAGQIVGMDDLKEQWIIGYIIDLQQGIMYCLVSTTDGLVTPHWPKNEFAEVLTEGGYLPVVLLDRVKRQ